MADSLPTAAYVGLLGAVVLAAAALVLLSRKSQAQQVPAAAPAASSKPPVARSSAFLTKKRQTVTLIERKDLSHDVRLYRFALASPSQVLGLPVGKHVKLFCPNAAGVKEGEWNGRPDEEVGKAEVERKYTPTSSDEDRGHFDLVIKHYERGVKERFPDGGKMSQHLESLIVGDSVDVQGPVGLHAYYGRGLFKTGRSKEHRASQVGMIAGGTGITPMLQIIRSAMRDASDATEFSLLFANQTEEDIFLREELEGLQRDHPSRFKLWYTVDRPPLGWKYSSGFIDAEMINAHLPSPGEGTVVLMCGPPPMIKFACKPNLEKLGFEKSAFIEF